MGGDGGSIPGRCDVVRVKGYEFKRNLGGMGYDPNTLVKSHQCTDYANDNVVFQICQLSKEPLQPPLVIDREGCVYNKAKLFEALLAKRLPPHIKRKVRKTRDVIQIHPRAGDEGAYPAFNETTKTLQCQITGDPLTLGKPSYFSSPCGCLYSGKGIENLPKDDAGCPVCGEKDTIKTRITVSRQNSSSPYDHK